MRIVYEALATRHQEEGLAVKTVASSIVSMQKAQKFRVANDCN